VKNPAGAVEPHQAPDQNVGSARDRGTVADFHVHGLVVVRLIDAPQPVLDSVARQLGPARPGSAGEPDLVFRFVEALPPVGYLRLLGLHQAAFDDEHFYLVDGAGRRARVDLARVGDRTEILCDARMSRIPLLIPLVGLYVLRSKHVLLHAASFVYRGKGVLVTGWQKGGKTETLLPFMAAGAQYIADEWTIVGGEEPGLYGISNVARIWDWHFRYLPQYWDRINTRQRTRLRAWRLYSMAFDRLPRQDALDRLPGGKRLRQLSSVGGSAVQGVDSISPSTLFGDRVWTGRAKLDLVFLPVLGEEEGTHVVPVDSSQIAQRMVSSLAFERAALTTAYQQFRFAFPDRLNPLIETVREEELRLLTNAFTDIPGYEIRHPYPVPLDDLYQAAQAYC
jgi:hypothetical protein